MAGRRLIRLLVRHATSTNVLLSKWVEQLARVTFVMRSTYHIALQEELCSLHLRSVERDLQRRERLPQRREESPQRLDQSPPRSSPPCQEKPPRYRKRSPRRERHARSACRSRSHSPPRHDEYQGQLHSLPRDLVLSDAPIKSPPRKRQHLNNPPQPSNQVDFSASQAGHGHESGAFS